MKITSVRIPVDTEGAHIAVSCHEGTGPAMILIHGITSSGADFDSVVPALAENCRPITFDLRGHGNSDKPRSGYRYQHYVNDLTAVITALELDRPIILCHSLGGIIALYWAAQNPGDARALIIEDSPLRSGEGFRDAFEGWLRLNAMPEAHLRAWYAEKHPQWSDETLAMRTSAMARTSRAAISELMAASMANEGLDSTDSLARITEPVLFLHGDAATGSMVHPDDIRTLPDRMADVSLRRIPEAGHTIYRSHPDAWLSQVKSFVGQLMD